VITYLQLLQQETTRFCSRFRSRSADAAWDGSAYAFPQVRLVVVAPSWGEQDGSAVDQRQPAVPLEDQNAFSRAVIHPGTARTMSL
jgi:hypothetical protein